MKSIRSGAGQIYWDVPFVIAAIVCGGQSGRTSAPTNPQVVQTNRRHKDRTGVSSGSQSVRVNGVRGYTSALPQS